MPKKTSYKDAGVDIDAAQDAVSRIKKYVKDTYTTGVLSDVGSFGGMYELPDGTVLTASTDGVGTKLKIAFLTDIHETIGQDLVNHCVNDILVQGATPLFFLDYIGTGKVKPQVIEYIVKGLSQACKENGCALIGGEVAEMPGVYKPGEYDLASFIVGKVDKKHIITGQDITPGDIVIGLPSTGLHTNGYSLAIKVLLNDAKLDLKKKHGECAYTLGEELLHVHKSYLPELSPLLPTKMIKAMAHITGGGLIDNVPRVLPEHTAVEITKSSWDVPPIFKLIQETGNVDPNEMFRVFNMGIGMTLIVDSKKVDVIKAKLPDAMVIGEVVEGKQDVTLK